MKIETGRMYLVGEIVEHVQRTGISTRAFFLPWKQLKHKKLFSELSRRDIFVCVPRLTRQMALNKIIFPLYRRKRKDERCLNAQKFPLETS